MRTPGHSGDHLTGLTMGLASYNLDETGGVKMSSPLTSGMFISRKAKWLTYSVGTLLWFLICFQIFVDVYVLAVR